MIGTVSINIQANQLARKYSASGRSSVVSSLIKANHRNYIVSSPLRRKNYPLIDFLNKTFNMTNSIARGIDTHKLSTLVGRVLRVFDLFFAFLHSYSSSSFLSFDFLDVTNAKSYELQRDEIKEYGLVCVPCDKLIRTKKSEILKVDSRRYRIHCAE